MYRDASGSEDSIFNTLATGLGHKWSSGFIVELGRFPPAAPMRRSDTLPVDVVRHPSEKIGSDQSPAPFTARTAKR